MQGEIKILLIDDDEDDFVITRKLIHGIKGEKYEVSWARSYDEGMEAVRNQEHDVCLLDYRLGERDGLEFLREACEGGCRMPIILLTGSGDREVDLEAAKAGASDYMVKGQISHALLERSIRYSIESKKIEQSRDAAVEAARRSEEKYLKSLIEKSDEALRSSETRFQSAFDYAPIGIGLITMDGHYQQVNQAFCEIVGYTKEELREMDFKQITHPDSLAASLDINRRLRSGEIKICQIEKQYLHKSGRSVWARSSVSVVCDSNDDPQYIITQVEDITERRKAEEQLHYDAFHDGLTGLANRALFMDHLRMTIERSKREHYNSYAVLFLDIDRFKVVNDSLGHAQGDKLLKKIGERLQTVMRTGDLLGRVGGDEFIILLTELIDDSDALRVADRIHGKLRIPFELAGREVFISTSIGIAFNTTGSRQPEEMLRDADIAMYRAKAKGSAQYQVFDQAMHVQASRKLELETEMRHALARGEFLVHYQPIVELATGSLVGFEALARWAHPERGLVSPLDFIPLAEETGLIIPLGKGILYESCRQLREWQQADDSASKLIISVNLSPRQFFQSDLADQIAEQLEKTGLSPNCLKLEITESHIMENTEVVIPIMNRLRDLGIQISLDDFGTGYSSLSYLHRLPIDYLKIDRSFVNRLEESPENQEIVSTIIKLAQNLKMKVIAEGIETADQQELLHSLNCEYGQGYYFSRPVDAKHAGSLIAGMGETVSAGSDRTLADSVVH